MDVQRHQLLHFQLFVSQRLRLQRFLVVDHRPRPLTVPHIQEEVEEEVSGCLSVLLLQVSSLTGLSLWWRGQTPGRLHAGAADSTRVSARVSGCLQPLPVWTVWEFLNLSQTTGPWPDERQTPRRSRGGGNSSLGLKHWKNRRAPSLLAVLEKWY